MLSGWLVVEAPCKSLPPSWAGLFSTDCTLFRCRLFEPTGWSAWPIIWLPFDSEGEMPPPLLRLFAGAPPVPCRCGAVGGEHLFSTGGSMGFLASAKGLL